MSDPDPVTDSTTRQWMPTEHAGASADADHHVTGIVVAVAHGFFEVAPLRTAMAQTWLCTARGRLRKPRPVTTPRKPVQFGKGRYAQGTAPEPEQTGAGRTPDRIAPGDIVRMQPLSETEGVIEAVLPRQRALERARSESGESHVMLANPDHAALVFATCEPVPHFGMLDRYLALCERAGVDITICLNKVDLGIPPDVASALDLYRSLGYQVILTSAATGTGVVELALRLRGRTSLLTGPSGVGKSSLINDLLPEARQRTATISDSTGKGRHTTTGVRLLPLPEGGWLADSAGIRELALWKVPEDELVTAFVELRPFANECEYEGCEHGEQDEGCALQAARNRGAINPQRWQSFERLLAESRESLAPGRILSR